MRTHRRHAVCLLAVFLVPVTVRPASGARLLTVTVERDDQTVLRTDYQDNGRAPAAVVWRYLGAAPLMAETAPWVRATPGTPCDGP